MKDRYSPNIAGLTAVQSRRALRRNSCGSFVRGWLNVSQAGEHSQCAPAAYGQTNTAPRRFSQELSTSRPLATMLGPIQSYLSSEIPYRLDKYSKTRSQSVVFKAVSKTIISYMLPLKYACHHGSA